MEREHTALTGKFHQSRALAAFAKAWELMAPFFALQESGSRRYISVGSDGMFSVSCACGGKQRRQQDADKPVLAMDDDSDNFRQQSRDVRSEIHGPER